MKTKYGINIVIYLWSRPDWMQLIHWYAVIFSYFSFIEIIPCMSYSKYLVKVFYIIYIASKWVNWIKRKIFLVANQGCHSGQEADLILCRITFLTWYGVCIDIVNLYGAGITLVSWYVVGTTFVTWYGLYHPCNLIWCRYHPHNLIWWRYHPWNLIWCMYLHCNHHYMYHHWNCGPIKTLIHAHFYNYIQSTQPTAKKVYYPLG